MRLINLALSKSSLGPRHISRRQVSHRERREDEGVEHAEDDGDDLEARGGVVHGVAPASAASLASGFVLKLELKRAP